MANIVLVIGDSGTGKSASLRNFKPDEVLVINCAGKPLPFKNHFEQVTPGFETLTRDVQKALQTTDKKVVVIDDAQYIMSFQYMRRIKENGWDKWNDIQGDFFNVIKDAKNLPGDVVVYFLSHLQRDDAGHEKVKTMGKMLDEKITIEGLFTIVLKTLVADGQYYFLTQNSGLDTVKSPIGMFDTYAIDNDLKYVDAKIRNYYEIGDYASDEAVKEMDVEVAHPEVEKPAADGRKRRSRRSSSSADREQGEVEAEAFDKKMAQKQKEAERKVEDVEKKEEKPAEAPAEEKKEEAEAESVNSEFSETTKAMFEKHKRRRKARTEGAESLETATADLPAEETADAPKRRRKKRTQPAEDPFMDVADIPDEELPFN
jgi:outer membrane biosynthesis protein TonB